MTNALLLRPTNREPLSPRTSVGYAQSLWILLLAGTMMLSACGGSSSGSGSQQSATLSRNWQFTMANPVDSSGETPFFGGLQGGFLLQQNGSVTGQAVYAVAVPPTTSVPNPVPCNSGSATITGTISSQNVALTAVAGSQTFTLTGTLNSDGSMAGTYKATAGTAADGITACGIATTQTNWRAIPVPPLTGSITGSFHSTPDSALADQDFPVTGFFTQGENIGASNATVTGTLSFIDPTTLLSDYPCFPNGLVSVNGQISGSTVILQLIGTDGSNDGQIGIAPSEANLGALNPVTFEPTTPNILHSKTGNAYVVNTKTCGGSGTTTPGDIGNICLALNSTTACQQPITLSPAVLTFPPQMLGSTNPSTQTITLINNSGNELDGLMLTWSAQNGLNGDTGQTDFTGLANFFEQDNCVPGGETLPPGQSPGSSFSLASGQSCSITVSFAPQESCTWLPETQGGAAPAQCPLTLIASLTVNNVPSVDPETDFRVPITGAGVSFVQPSTPELDFGAEAFGEASLPQLLSFTNYGATPVQILPPGTCVDTFDSVGNPITHLLPHPLTFGSQVAGLQVVIGGDLTQDTNSSTIQYACDDDPNTLQSNFQISADTCSGALLHPQAACSLEITFVPQSTKTYFSSLDYFLELNTVQCPDPVNDPPSQLNPCELDGGRFPVELRANIASPLRLSPSAGLDFGTVSVGKSSVPQTIALFNDPNDPNAGTVTFVGKFVVSGAFSETDDCPYSLASGSSCTITVTFKPSAVGPVPFTSSGLPPNIAVNYTANGTNLQTQYVYLRGTGQ